jgi:hypothetical protein
MGLHLTLPAEAVTPILAEKSRRFQALAGELRQRAEASQEYADLRTALGQLASATARHQGLAATPHAPRPIGPAEAEGLVDALQRGGLDAVLGQEANEHYQQDALAQLIPRLRAAVEQRRGAYRAAAKAIARDLRGRVQQERDKARAAFADFLARGGDSPLPDVLQLEWLTTEAGLLDHRADRLAEEATPAPAPGALPLPA